MANGAVGLQDEFAVKSLGYGSHTASFQGRSASASKLPTVNSTHTRSSPCQLEAMAPSMNVASEGRNWQPTTPGNKSRSPLSQVARKRAGSTSALVHVHKLSLRSFKELEEQQSSISNVQHPSLYPRQRFASLSSASTFASTLMSRPSSRPRPKESMQAELPGNEDEIHKMNLHASRGSNTTHRSTSTTPNLPCLCPSPRSGLMPPSRSSLKLRPKDSAQMDFPNREDEARVCIFEELDAEQQWNQLLSVDFVDEIHSQLNVLMPGRGEASSPACSLRSSSSLSPTEEFAKGVRPLSGSECEQRKQETEDWFRAARDINNSGRSLEEADMLLAAARSRRTTSDSSGVGFSSRSASKTQRVSPTAEAAKEVVDENKAKRACVAAPRLCVDPVALWSAKAEAAAAKLKLAKAPTVVHGARRMHTISGEGVAFGPDGGNSLRSRLSKRIINSEQI